MKSGLKVFDEIPKWNVVAWTNLIAGYVNNDCATEAIRVFKDMESLNVEPNEITLVHVLVAELFDEMPKRNLVAWNSMIAGYNQYGQAEEALGVFSIMLVSGFDPDNSTFLSVVSACGKAGDLALGQSFHAYELKMNICKDRLL
ncbi:hypothetical protein Q3G72_020963 [Acer saccharum]|nr:hypothetical protein Q3G72_020963 [Acer saccharum]